MRRVTGVRDDLYSLEAKATGGEALYKNRGKSILSRNNEKQVMNPSQDCSGPEWNVGTVS